MVNDAEENLILWGYGTSFNQSRIASRVQNTKDENRIAINDVKYFIGKSLRKRSADFFVDFLVGLRIFLNAKEGGFHCAKKLLAQSSVLVLVPAIRRREVELCFRADEETV